MSNESIVPPDIREQMPQPSRGGIGGGAVENESSSMARESAMSATSTTPEPEKKAAPKEKVTEELKACPTCRKELADAWSFCAACGTDLVRGGAAKRLGIEFGEEDLNAYLFKGFVIRDIPILGKHQITTKSSQPTDLDAIDRYIMNGDWGKTADGAERKVSDFYLRQMNALCVTASAIIKVDGESIGDSLEQRIAWMSERGSAFVDIVSQRVTLFNQALTQFLKDEDTFLGS